MFIEKLEIKKPIIDPECVSLKSSIMAKNNNSTYNIDTKINTIKLTGFGNLKNKGKFLPERSTLNIYDLRNIGPKKEKGTIYFNFRPKKINKNKNQCSVDSIKNFSKYNLFIRLFFTQSQKRNL